MIKIVEVNKHEGFKIHYKHGHFYAKKGKEEFYSSSSEQQVIDSIDAKLEADEKDNLEKVRAKQLEKQKKNLKTSKIVFDGLEFKQFIGACNGLMQEGQLVLRKGEMRLTGMDPANVAMIHRTVKYTGNIDFGECAVNLKEIHSFLKKAYKGGMFKLDKITMRFVMVGETIYMYLGNEFGEVRFPTLELEEKEAKVPKLKHKATFTMPIKEFYKYVEMADMVAETVQFFVKKGRFGVKAEGDLTQYHKDNILKVKGGRNRNCVSKYSLSYLKKTKAMFFSENITVMLNTNYPLQLVDDDGNIFILAPRVDND